MKKLPPKSTGVARCLKTIPNGPGSTKRIDREMNLPALT